MADTTDRMPLTVGARRRLLCELADLYNAEQDRGHQPISEGLPGLLGPSLCAAHLNPDDALKLFARFARERAQIGRSDVSYGRMAAAEVLAEGFLNELVGETL